MSADVLAVDVAIDGQTVHAGTAYFTTRGRALTTSFVYDRAYLANPRAYSLDPALPFYQGQHITLGLPGAFADCTPALTQRRCSG